jgi:hypothetical protein
MAAHQRPSAYHSFDCAVLVVGDRTAVGSTTKSGKVMPIGGATDPSLGAVLADADGPPLAGGRDGVGEGAGGRASAITATIDTTTTSTSAPSASQGRSIPFVAAPSPRQRGAKSQA